MNCALNRKQKRLIGELVNEVVCLCIITYGLTHFEKMRDIRGLFGELGKFQRILTLVEYGTSALEYIDSKDTFGLLNVTELIKLNDFNALEPILTYFLKLIRTQRIPEDFKLYNKMQSLHNKYRSY
jgi:hypothetical protein